MKHLYHLLSVLCIGIVAWVVLGDVAAYIRPYRKIEVKKGR